MKGDHLRRKARTWRPPHERVLIVRTALLTFLFLFLVWVLGTWHW